MSVLKNKKIVLGVTGSIAAYKACEIVRLLRKAGADVHVMLTRSGAKMVGPATFAALSNHEVMTDLFEEKPGGGLEHIEMAETADAVVVAPATANIIAKAAHGIADDLVSTTLVVCDVPTLFAPAMNFRMWRHEATQLNAKAVKERGATIVEPEQGLLATLAAGEGRMAEPETIVAALRELLGTPQDYAGKRVLVTAGPTHEPIDPVRYISNRSSGKMGYAIAEAAQDRGATVTLISGPTSVDPPPGCEVTRVETADDMQGALKKTASNQDLIVMAAAVADFKPAGMEASKIKRAEIPGQLPLEPTPDILKGLSDGTDAVLVGFALETEHGEENARKKMKEKRLDAIVLNWANRPDSGFESDTNEGTLFLKKRRKGVPLPLESKQKMAHRILSEIVGLICQTTDRST